MRKVHNQLKKYASNYIVCTNGCGFELIGKYKHFCNYGGITDGITVRLDIDGIHTIFSIYSYTGENG